jgi:hypothetical protein
VACRLARSYVGWHNACVVMLVDIKLGRVTLNHCVALGAVRSGASGGVRPGLAVLTIFRFPLGAPRDT